MNGKFAHFFKNYFRKGYGELELKLNTTLLFDTLRSDVAALLTRKVPLNHSAEDSVSNRGGCIEGVVKRKVPDTAWNCTLVVKLDRLLLFGEYLQFLFFLRIRY
jgi:hypothetical protein